MNSLLFQESLDLVVFIMIPFLFIKNYIYIYLICLCFLIYFYRVPNRPISILKDDTIVSPCDGTVLDVFKEHETYRIAVFLSIWNVHVQWYPVSGRVLNVHHKLGEFNPAFLLEKSKYNERCSTVIQHKYGQIQVDQIAGQVARRIVNRARVGAYVEQGQHMGMIKLSSRVDILVPSTTNVLVKQGDRVYGNITELAKWNITNLHKHQQ